MKIDQRKCMAYGIGAYICYILFLCFIFYIRFKWSDGTGNNQYNTYYSGEADVQEKSILNELIYVITENKETHEVKYYEINGRKIKAVNEFVSDQMIIYRPLETWGGIYNPERVENYINHYTHDELKRREELDETGRLIANGRRKLSNSYNLEVILDEHGIEVELPIELYEVLVQLSKYHYNLLGERIWIYGDEIYISADINAGISKSHVLFQYDKDALILNRVSKFNNEEVIGIKLQGK